MRNIIVGTRESKLALAQTNEVINLLKRSGVKNSINIKKFSTAGDKQLNVSLSEFRGRGVFSNEMEEALQTNLIDFAVHSMKDLPINSKESLTIAAIPKREDPREAFLANNHVKLTDLPKGSVIGTSSLRRVAQLRSMRPDVQTNWIRGPIDSRIKQLGEGKFDAIILAVAGLNRLAFTDEITQFLSLDSFVPAAGQGALAIQCRKDDVELKEFLKHIHDEDTALAIEAERLLIKQLDPNERAPIGSYASVASGVITLKGMILSAEGERIISSEYTGMNPDDVAKQLADKLIKLGAYEIIEEFSSK